MKKSPILIKNEHLNRQNDDYMINKAITSKKNLKISLKSRNQGSQTELMKNINKKKSQSIVQFNNFQKNSFRQQESQNRTQTQM